MDKKEQTTEKLLQDFHNNNSKKTKKETSSEELLSICALIFTIISIIAFFVLWLVCNLNLFLSLACGFSGFILGLTLYVLAKICRVLVEIRDNQ